ncbi:MAG: MotA/TolQ/ExbB proton channel family protein [Bacillota bacterium]|jgi:biopolymer transport protein ExbB
MSFFDLISKGGLLMYPIVLCSVIALAIALERWYYFFRIRGSAVGLPEEVNGLLREGRWEEVETLCTATGDPVMRIIAAGLQVREKPVAERDDILARVGSAELRRLTGHLRGLGIVAHISPLLGLLGTVTGMMAAFMKIQELGGEVDAAMLAGGIWEALITTAAWLTVAIPTMVFYHYFEGKIDTYYARMKEAAQLLTERLGEKQLAFASEPARVEDVEYGV